MAKKRKKAKYWFARMDGEFAIFGSRAHNGCYIFIGWNDMERRFHEQGRLVVPKKGAMIPAERREFGRVHLPPGTLEPYTPPHIMARFIARSMVADRRERDAPIVTMQGTNFLINDDGSWRPII